MERGNAYSRSPARGKGGSYVSVQGGHDKAYDERRVYLHNGEVYQSEFYRYGKRFGQRHRQYLLDVADSGVVFVHKLFE